MKVLRKVMCYRFASTNKKENISIDILIYIFLLIYLILQIFIAINL